MTDQERFEKLISGPTMKTWHGIIERIKLMDMGDRWFLAYCLHCGIDDLDKMLHRYLNQSSPWQLTTRGDPACRGMADLYYGRPVGSGPEQFVPPGRCCVLKTPDTTALWVTVWQQAGAFRYSHAWRGAWRNSLYWSQDGADDTRLIESAVAATRSMMGAPPTQGMVVFVNPAVVWKWRRRVAGYLRAGFHRAGETKGGLHCLQMLPEDMPAPAMPCVPSESSAAQRPSTSPL